MLCLVPRTASLTVVHVTCMLQRHINSIKARFIPDDPQANYWVVDTDYNNYSLVWSCADYKVVSLEFAWVLSRKQTLDDAIVSRLKEKLASFEIDIRSFVVTNQTNCPEPK